MLLRPLGLFCGRNVFRDFGPEKLSNPVSRDQWVILENRHTERNVGSGGHLTKIQEHKDFLRSWARRHSKYILAKNPALSVHLPRSGNELKWTHLFDGEEISRQ